LSCHTLYVMLLPNVPLCCAASFVWDVRLYPYLRSCEEGAVQHSVHLARKEARRRAMGFKRSRVVNIQAPAASGRRKKPSHTLARACATRRHTRAHKHASLLARMCAHVFCKSGRVTIPALADSLEELCADPTVRCRLREISSGQRPGI
jgi:hypothetical protein